MRLSTNSISFLFTIYYVRWINYLSTQFASTSIVRFDDLVFELRYLLHCGGDTSSRVPVAMSIKAPNVYRFAV